MCVHGQRKTLTFVSYCCHNSRIKNIIVIDTERKGVVMDTDCQEKVNEGDDSSGSDMSDSNSWNDPLGSDTSDSIWDSQDGNENTDGGSSSSSSDEDYKSDTTSTEFTNNDSSSLSEDLRKLFSSDAASCNGSKTNLSYEEFRELYSYANEFREQENFYDVTIKIGNRSFKCHRVILASAIEYFRNMFNGNFAEGQKKEIEVKCVDANDFQLLLAYIYGHGIEIKHDNFFGLWRISNYLGQRSLENACIAYLVNNSNSISLDFILRTFMFACKTRKTFLVEKLIPAMARNFEYLTNYVEFCKIPGGELLTILSHESYSCSESTLLDFLAYWIKNEGDEGVKFLPFLLKEIHSDLEKITLPASWVMKMITKDFSYRGVNNVNEAQMLPFSLSVDLYDMEEDLSFESPFLFFTLDTAYEECDGGKLWPTSCMVNLYNYIITRSGNHVVQYVNQEFNLGTGDNYVCCKSVFIDETRFTILGQIDDLLKISFIPYCYHDQNRQSLKTYEGEGQFQNIAIAAHKSDIYLCNADVFVKYSIQRDEWIDVSTYDFSWTEFSNLISHKDNLYVIGGQENARTATALFQRLDPREGKWFQMPEMIYPRCKSSSCIYNDSVYVAGGDDFQSSTNSVEYFDFRAGKWKILESSMPNPRMNQNLISYNDQLWFFGGESSCYMDSIVKYVSWYSYDLKENLWSHRSRLPALHGKFTYIEQILDVIVTNKKE